MKGYLVAVALAAFGVLVPAAAADHGNRPCPELCGQRGGPKLLAVRELGAGRIGADLFLRRAASLELVIARFTRGRLIRVRPAVIGEHPRVTLTGRMPVGGRREQVADVRLGSVRAGLRSRAVRLAGRGQSLAPGTYILSLDALMRRGRARGSSIVVRVKRRGRVLYLLQPRMAPDAASGGADAIAQTSAVLSGSLHPYGQATSYYFEYGPTTAYGERTASRPAGAGRRPLRVSARLDGLSLATTYHYRLVATACSGCAWGTSYGSDRSLTTLAEAGLSTQQVDADRAITAYNAMQRYFYAANVYPGDASSLYVKSDPQAGNRYSYLWPFSRALAATITLAGIPPTLLGGASYEPAVGDRLAGLARYWDGRASGPGYDSYPPPPYGGGGDKYYDDQAWVGLAAAQSYRRTGDPGSLSAAENVFNFVYPGGWAGGASFEPGGIYWVQQGVGKGLSNHDRTTTSTVPNSELALLLEGLDPANASGYDAAANEMFGWANHYLYNVGSNPTDADGPNPNFDPSQPALMFDKVRGDDTIDKTLWTYNQGTMIAADVREYQRTGLSAYLAQAEAIANTALDTFAEADYLAQPAAFDAIFFRGLLVLYAATSDDALRSRIMQTIQGYADDAWANHRSATGLFSFPSSSGSGYQLLDQGAMVEIYAALAWDPADYDKLP